MDQRRKPDPSTGMEFIKGSGGRQFALLDWEAELFQQDTQQESEDDDQDEYTPLPFEPMFFRKG